MNKKRVLLFKMLSYLLGPLIFLLILLIPTDLTADGQHFLAAFVLVISMWIFTEVPLFISGILGVALCSIMGLVSAKDALAPFAHPIIFLFMAGFLFAKALEKTQLDDLLAYKILRHPKVQRSPQLMILAFYGIAFITSMWISNTAAVAMLLPLAFGLIKKIKNTFHIENDSFEGSLLLGLAYTATIGGNLSPIGSPPNIIAVGLLKSLNNQDLGFLEWIAMAIPFSVILFIFVYWQTVKYIPSFNFDEIDLEVTSPKSLDKDQIFTLTLFLLTILFWISPSVASLALGKSHAVTLFIKKNLSTSIVGLFFSSLLFLIPINGRKKILTSKDIKEIDWPSLLLFGAGLSLGGILFKTGMAKIFATHMASYSSTLGPYPLLLIFIFITIFFTEIASNTATANIVIPIMIAFSNEVHINSVLVAFLLALSCNSAFMLPVATPPNVIVYGTNKVSKKDMILTGWKINLVAFAIICCYVAVAASL